MISLQDPTTPADAVLQLLASGPRTPERIAARLGITPAQSRRTCRELLTAGLVEIDPGTQRLRRHMLQRQLATRTVPVITDPLTPAGATVHLTRTLARQLAPKIDVVLARLVGHRFTAAEVALTACSDTQHVAAELDQRVAAGELISWVHSTGVLFQGRYTGKVQPGGLTLYAHAPVLRQVGA